MKSENKILLSGFLAIAVLDALGSIASRQFNFDYASLSIVSYSIFGAVGFFVTRATNLWTGVLYAALVGLFDSTIGWKISMALKANNENIEDEVTIAFWLAVSVMMTATAGLAGLGGAVLAKILFRNKTNSQS
ncbi:MAG: hypothetical protein QM762_04450 [Chryseolinea sp.]